MSFDDRLTASFRGVTFLLETAGGKGGRRAIPHAYPKKESGWTEDHGAVLTNQSITGRVVGKNYMTQLRDLLTALNTAGPGEFVHPWWGVQQVQVGEVSHELVNEEDQTATVTFQLFEAGTNLFPSSSADTAAKIKSAASDAADSNNSWFSSLWDSDAIDGMGTMIDTNSPMVCRQRHLRCVNGLIAWLTSKIALGHCWLILGNWQGKSHRCFMTSRALLQILSGH
jgi:prophage DNA circulation protein